MPCINIWHDYTSTCCIKSVSSLIREISYIWAFSKKHCNRLDTSIVKLLNCESVFKQQQQKNAKPIFIEGKVETKHAWAWLSQNAFYFSHVYSFHPFLSLKHSADINKIQFWNKQQWVIFTGKLMSFDTCQQPLHEIDICFHGNGIKPIKITQLPCRRLEQTEFWPVPWCPDVRKNYDAAHVFMHYLWWICGMFL